MKISIDVSEEMAIAALTDIAENILWHINNDIQTMIKKKKAETYILKDLSYNIELLKTTNTLIEYHGGKPVEIRACEVKFGHDIYGNKFK